MALPENEFLQYIYKTADMGQDGLQSVIGYVEDPALKQELSSQMAEYELLCKEAASLLQKQGEEASGVNTVAKVSADVMSAGKLLLDRSPSKIAEMAIQGNTMGITKTIKHLHSYEGKDKAILALGNRLLSTEEANVKQLEAFL